MAPGPCCRGDRLLRAVQGPCRGRLIHTVPGTAGPDPAGTELSLGAHVCSLRPRARVLPSPMRRARAGVRVPPLPSSLRPTALALCAHVCSPPSSACAGPGSRACFPPERLLPVRILSPQSLLSHVRVLPSPSASAGACEHVCLPLPPHAHCRRAGAPLPRAPTQPAHPSTPGPARDRLLPSLLAHFCHQKWQERGQKKERITVGRRQPESVQQLQNENVSSHFTYDITYDIT